MVTVKMVVHFKEGSEVDLKTWDNFYNRMASKNHPAETPENHDGAGADPVTSKKECF
ncbi:hypothetical protein ABFB09_09135 [Dehalogenimonas sp. THU2]|uniref:hypothetical protein n=1 Tax=Dehalogenimonas sp. THU2 TaxID=3151121 RepID=UPI003218279D